MRTRSEALTPVDDRVAARAIEGSLLCFLMIPVIGRFGQWRFAGAASNLDEAFARLAGPEPRPIAVSGHHDQRHEQRTMDRGVCISPWCPQATRSEM
jgi:hypothetical protein